MTVYEEIDKATETLYNELQRGGHIAVVGRTKGLTPEKLVVYLQQGSGRGIPSEWAGYAVEVKHIGAIAAIEALDAEKGKEAGNA